MNGQISLEFLLIFSIMLLLFVTVVFMYSLNVEESNAIKDKLDATVLCQQVSSSINSLASFGGNSTYNFNMSEDLNSKNYTIRIASNSSLVRIDYDVSGTGCSIRTTNITNSSGSTLFEIQKNATIRSNGGVIRVEP